MNRHLNVFLLGLCLTTGLVAQDPGNKPAADPAADVAACVTALDKVIAGGPAAREVLEQARLVYGEPLGAGVLRTLSSALKGSAAPDPAPDAAVLKADVQDLGQALRAVQGHGEAAVPAVAAAAIQASGPARQTLDRLRHQLLAGVVVAELESFIVGGSYHGTYDGMFPRAAALQREGAEIMLELLRELSRPVVLRRLAAEGVAQLGTQDDIPAVEELWKDGLDDPTVREAARCVLARFGRRDVFGEDLKQIEQAIAAATEKLAAGTAGQAALEPRIAELEALTGRTPEQDQELADLEARHEAARRLWAEGCNRLGAAWQAWATIFQGIGDWKEAEKAYVAMFEAWNPIGNMIMNYAPLRRQASTAIYNRACCRSLLGRPLEALTDLKRAWLLGYEDLEWASQDGDLTKVRELEAWKSFRADISSGAWRKRWLAEFEAQKAAGKEPPEEGGMEQDPSREPTGSAHDSGFAPGIRWSRGQTGHRPDQSSGCCSRIALLISPSAGNRPVSCLS
jgi:tetratricopeptide (TPR) repeat protein